VDWFLVGLRISAGPTDLRVAPITFIPNTQVDTAEVYQNRHCWDIAEVCQGYRSGSWFVFASRLALRTCVLFVVTSLSQQVVYLLTIVVQRRTLLN
jgi:hypothetical protein